MQYHPELGDLLKVASSCISLGANQLTGKIPAELGNLPNLKKLSLDRNRLRVASPPNLETCPSSGNSTSRATNFTGAIPPEIGKFFNPNVVELILQENRLKGEIPDRNSPT